MPPWAGELPDTDADTDAGDDGDEAPEQTPEVPSLPEVAPAARFRDARRTLGNFVRTGDTDELRRSLGFYVRRGYGGASTFGRRLGSTPATAGRLNTVLSTGRAPDGSRLDDQLPTDGDAYQLMDAIVEAVRPVDGTQDAEASRRAMRDALADVLEQYPDADLLALDEVQRALVIERYTAFDVYNRFALDMQQTVLDKAPSAAAGLSRMKQIRAFIREQVAAAFRRVHEGGGASTTPRGVTRIVRNALAEVLRVFEEYL